MKKKVSELKLNPNNPRFIRDEKYEKLKNSIHTFPEMMEARPVVVDEQGIILGGNMRFRAVKELGWKEVEVKELRGLTEKQKKEFVIKDNASFGEWDWELLANEWDNNELREWGIDVWSADDVDLDELFKDREESGSDKMEKLILQFDTETYNRVITELKKHGKTNEHALLNLLK